MPDCNKTIVFFEELARMCTATNDCTNCDLAKYAKSVGEKHCGNVITQYPSIIIQIVQKWSDAHQLPKPKTYEDELKKLLPASLLYRKNKDGKQEVNLCRQMLFDSEPPYCNGYIVDKVCMKCWNEPYPEQVAGV